MSQAYWEGAFDLKLGVFGLPEIWLKEKLYMHGQQFNLWVAFEEGIAVSQALELFRLFPDGQICVCLRTGFLWTP